MKFNFIKLKDRLIKLRLILGVRAKPAEFVMDDFRKPHPNLICLTIDSRDPEHRPEQPMGGDVNQIREHD